MARSQSAPTFTSGFNVENSLKIPDQICAVLADIAKIRRTILESAPQCLPLLAPTIVDAEEHLLAIANR